MPNTRSKREIDKESQAYSSSSEEDTLATKKSSAAASREYSSSSEEDSISAITEKRSAAAINTSSGTAIVATKKPSATATATEKTATANMSQNQTAPAAVNQNQKAPVAVSQNEKRRKTNPSGSPFEEKVDIENISNMVPNFKKGSHEYKTCSSFIKHNNGLVSLDDMINGNVKVTQFHVMPVEIVDIRNKKQVMTGEKGKKGSKPTSCERLIKVHCPRTKGPVNVAVLIVSSGIASKDDRCMWGPADEARDNGKIGKYLANRVILSMILHLTISIRVQHQVNLPS